MADEPGKPPSGPSSDEASVLRQVGAMAGVGFEFILAVLIPAAAGYWLDKRFGLFPRCLIVGGVFGFGVGLYRLLKSAAAAMK
ncbi:MAG: AtpZ/AtpI family protein [Tepidisphaeraceae bacterium]